MAKMTEGVENQPRQGCSNAFQTGVSTEGSVGVTQGTHTAVAPSVFLLGSMTSMAGVAKVLGLMVMAVLPGGLLFLAAYVLGREVALAVRREEGTTGRRFAKAWARVRLRDVWTSAKQSL